MTIFIIAFICILLLLAIAPFLIGYTVVRITEKERPKGFGKAIYYKSKDGLIEQQKIAHRAATFIPNNIPKKEIVKRILTSALLLLYGGYGVATDSLHMPARGDTVELYGISAWLMYMSFMFASLNLLTVVLDHYDRRDNESIYRAFEKFFKIMACIFFLIAMFTWLTQEDLKHIH